MITTTTNVILATDTVITAILKVISATTKVILATGEVITATLKVISAIRKLILTSNKLVWATEKISKPEQSDFGHWRSDHSHFKNYLSR